jgi:predicted transcriptional regulator
MEYDQHSAEQPVLKKPPAAKWSLRRIGELLEAEVLAGECLLDSIVIETAGAADLMSDVLAFSRSGTLLLTGLANAQSLHTADVAEMKAIVYVRGKRPDAVTVQKAEDRGIPLLCTRLGMFECCGRLYQIGIRDDGDVTQS